MRKNIGRLRKNFPDVVVLVKSGNFYRCYDDDSYILAYLMGYQVKTTIVSEMTGFPVDSLNKVMDKFENNKVSYKVFDLKDGELVLKEESIFEEENCYDKVYEDAEKYINKRNRIENITNILYENIEKENVVDALAKIEDVVNDL